MIVTIEKCDTGYVLRKKDSVWPVSKAVNTLDEAMRDLLFLLEGRAEHFTKPYYGKVTIDRSPPTTSSGPTP